jgi:ABC-type lipoprotein export system ATPase subunit
MTTKKSLIEQLYEQYGGDISKIEKDLADIKRNKSPKVQPANNNPVVVSLKNVVKTYKGGSGHVTAVDNISFDIREGEIVALVGPSGSGKSTVLNVIGGLDRPSEGIAVVDGVDVGKLKGSEKAVYRNQHVGFVFQFFYLQPYLNLQTNVEVPDMFAKNSKSNRHQTSKELIEAVGLTDRISHLPKELSGGQMQRAAIARALLNRPKIILADEPTGNLDSKNASEVMDLFQQVRKDFGSTIIIVTHDQKMAQRADRIIELVDGKVAN